MMYLVAEARRWFASVVRRFMAYGWVQLWGGSVLTKKNLKIKKCSFQNIIELIQL